MPELSQLSNSAGPYTITLFSSYEFEAGVDLPKITVDPVYGNPVISNLTVTPMSNGKSVTGSGTVPDAVNLKLSAYVYGTTDQVNKSTIILYYQNSDPAYSATDPTFHAGKPLVSFNGQRPGIRGQLLWLV